MATSTEKDNLKSKEAEEGYKLTIIDDFRTCPPRGYLEYLIRMLLTVFLLWSAPWSVIGDYMLPYKTGFGLIYVLITSLFFGILVTKIPMPMKLPPLPALLGHLLMGVVLRNLPFGLDGLVTSIDSGVSSSVRKIALTVILIRAGVGLDAKALRKMKGVCFRLSLTPCVTEACIDAVAAYFIMGFPIKWGFMLGFVIAAISPAVVVPSMVSLGDRGYGIRAGIPSLMIAAASIDDILAISLFHIILGLTDMDAVHTLIDQQSNETATMANLAENLSTMTPAEHVHILNDTAGQEIFHSLGWQIARGPVELIVGVVGGILLGLLLWFIPNKHGRSSKSKGRLESGIIRDRTFLVFALSLLCMFGSKRAQIHGSGPVAVLIIAFVASMGWGKKGREPVKVAMARIWFYGQPLLFGLIGAEVDFWHMDTAGIGGGLAVLGIGLIFRIIAAFLATIGGEIGKKEALFIALGWLPKATVQAAIGGSALDHARALEGSEDSLRMGQQILTIAALSIVITAPLGAVLIGLLGPKWLHRVRRPSTVSQTDFEMQEQKDSEEDEE